MHRQNIFLAALLLALLITVAFRMFPALNHWDVLGWMYFPAIVVTVLMSGNSHSPSEVAGWVTFITYTLMYWGIFFIVYALLLELYLIRSTFGRVESAHHLLRAHAMAQGYEQSQANIDDELQRFGATLSAIEKRRRGHLFLRDLKSLNLNDDPEYLGAHAIANLGDEHVVKALLKHFQTRLAKEMGEKDASAFINNLKEEANSRSKGTSSV